MWRRSSTSRRLVGKSSLPSGAAQRMKDVQRSRTMRDAHAAQGQGAHRSGRGWTPCRQYVWDTLPAGCLDRWELLWLGVSVRDAGARSVLDGMTPCTVWQSSTLDGSGNTSDVSSRSRYARSWYVRVCERQHGWPRIPFLLCQRDRHHPSRLLVRGLLRASHDTRRCFARPPQTDDRQFSSYSLLPSTGTRSPCAVLGMVLPRPAAREGLQHPPAAPRAGPWIPVPLTKRESLLVEQEHTAGVELSSKTDLCLVHLHRGAWAFSCALLF